MKKLSTYLTLAAFAVVGILGLLNPELAGAAGAEDIREGVNAAGVEEGADINEIIGTVANILVFIVGAASVIMIIISAIRYTTANGDQSQITSAKNTLLYAIVGLILAIAAGAIVNFVLAQFAG